MRVFKSSADKRIKIEKKNFETGRFLFSNAILTKIFNFVLEFLVSFTLYQSFLHNFLIWSILNEVLINFMMFRESLMIEVSYFWDLETNFRAYFEKFQLLLWRKSIFLLIHLAKKTSRCENWKKIKEKSAF